MTAPVLLAILVGVLVVSLGWFALSQRPTPPPRKTPPNFPSTR